MQLEPGTILLHYRLVARLGEGGMGVVWKAVDTTLDREVAVKILPDIFASDPDRSAPEFARRRIDVVLDFPLKLKGLEKEGAH